ncbi:MAG: saccharopine dehydrogenase NADP-binding domain-containing protein [Caldilinea sp.]|nr:saccharopine dehydrogenase NADP-binding domain-containing protein [Caldilinea sp.]MDW8439405.1 saccharopine dehydrogenase C-terminal domain-containing protein [Caldilineaceae bacterium]
MQISVLGSGLVGGAIVKDLAQTPDFHVTVIDRNPDAVHRLESEAKVRGCIADLNALDDFSRLLSDADLVVCAVPGYMGFSTLQKVIAACKNVVDISFFAEDPFLLDEPAQQRNVTAVIDCGVAPGLSNILLGDLTRRMERIERYECYVGGLPEVRRRPFEYKAVFSPLDVLEEYTRPARFVECGREVVRPALSDVELRNFPHIGTLEAFNTDGLRTLMRTMQIPFMKEKTLRYPGHADLMAALRESGFLSKEPLEVAGVRVAPIQLTAKLLFKQWRLQPGERDLTVMQVGVEGVEAGHSVRYTYDLFDRYDDVAGVTSMARTTGYTCTAVVRLVASGAFRRIGVCPPELVGQTPGCCEAVLDHLAARGVRVAFRREEIEHRV